MYFPFHDYNDAPEECWAIGHQRFLPESYETIGTNDHKHFKNIGFLQYFFHVCSVWWHWQRVSMRSNYDAANTMIEKSQLLKTEKPVNNSSLLVFSTFTDNELAKCLWLCRGVALWCTAPHYTDKHAFSVIRLSMSSYIVLWDVFDVCADTLHSAHCTQHTLKHTNTLTHTQCVLEKRTKKKCQHAAN